jgi:hypothetical protein
MANRAIFILALNVSLQTQSATSCSRLPLTNYQPAIFKGNSSEVSASPCLAKLRATKNSRSFLSWQLRSHVSQVCSKDGIDCCHQGGSSHHCAGTRRFCTHSAAILAGVIISGVNIPPRGGSVSHACIICLWFMPDAVSKTVVSQNHRFVSFSGEIFARAHEFLPDRWLQPEPKTLGSSCFLLPGNDFRLGSLLYHMPKQLPVRGPLNASDSINTSRSLAHCELYLAFAYPVSTVRRS